MGDQSRGGWIKAHRRLFEPSYPWPITWRYFFLDLIQLAPHRPHADLERGQVQISYRFLQARWGVGAATIKRLLDRLESDGAIKRVGGAERNRSASGVGTGTDATIITICNYDRYSGTSPGAERLPERNRSGTGANTRRRSEKKPGRDQEQPTTPRVAAPEKPTQRTQWPADLQKVWDVLLAIDLLGSDLDDSTWWAKQVAWIESTGLEVFPLDELKAYIAHQDSQTRSRQHRNRKRGFRNWLATVIRWRERDAAREAIRDKERDRR